MAGLEQMGGRACAPRRLWQRAPDRRRGVAAVIAAVVAAAPLAREPRLLRQRFEDELRELVHARFVELRDAGASPVRADVAISVDVTVGSSVLGAIDAAFDGGRQIDDWTRQCLASACPVAAVVLVLERVHRASGGPLRGEGAAPIIGSCPGIRLLRERIERVAATDFTVLVEGGIDPQSHPNSIDVFREVALCNGDREMARAGEDGAARALSHAGLQEPERQRTWPSMSLSRRCALAR